jgi:hypothetical protein
MFLLVWLIGSASIFGQTNVLTYHNDNMRTGQNLSETLLTPENVQSATFGKLFTLAVDGKVDAQPLLVSGLTIPGKGTHNVVFVATEHDSLFAFDADSGVAYWQVSLLKAGETTSDSRGCGQVVPEIGITATPVIDPSAGPHGTMYAVAMSKDGGGAYHQRLHAIDITTGVEQFDGPVDVQATYPGTGDNSVSGSVAFDPKQYKSRPGLLVVNGVVYTSWGSHCDSRPYTGWTIGYNETTLAQTSVFNFAPNGEGAAIWGAGGGATADSDGTLFFQVANGTFDQTLNAAGFPNMADYGNAFVKLSVAGAPTVLDYWTMFNTVSESNADEDLGSGGVLLIPDVTDAGGNTRHLGIGVGKDGDVYMFDRDNMGKFDPVNNGNLYQEIPSGLGGGEYATPAWFNGSVYFGAVGDVIRAFKMTAATLAQTPATSQTSFLYPGTTPSISANAALNGILWAVENSSPAVLHAYDPNNLATELYNSSQAPSNRDQFGNGNKFITPMIANGKVFVGTPNSVAVFGLLGPTLTSVTPAGGTQGTAVNVTLAGTNFAAGATVGVNGTGVTVSNVKVVNANQITATFTSGAAATVGPRNVTVTTSGGTSNAVTFTIAAAGSAPTLTSVTPAGGTQGTAVNVTLAGTNFAAGATVGVSGTGVTVSNVKVVNANQITATFTSGAAATVGPRNVTVTTTAGTSNAVTFTIAAAGSAPTLTSITPAGGTQGAAVNVTLAGTNFAAGATVGVSGTGVTVSNVDVVNANQLTATFTCGAAATVGPRNVTATTTAGTSNAVTFTVAAGGLAPTLTSIAPDAEMPDTQTTVTLAGANFAAGATVGVSGTGVTVSNVKVVNANQITATFTVHGAATPGPCNVTVTTTRGTSNAVTFTVEARPSPTLTSINPASGKQGTAVNVTLAGANFAVGATVGVSGTGVTVSNVKVVTPDQITATFTIQGAAAPGPLNVTVTTTSGTSNAVTFTVD